MNEVSDTFLNNTQKLSVELFPNRRLDGAACRSADRTGLRGESMAEEKAARGALRSRAASGFPRLLNRQFACVGVVAFHSAPSENLLGHS